MSPEGYLCAFAARVASSKAVAVCMLAPPVSAAVPAEVPEFLRGSQFGARKEDGLRTVGNDKKNFLGFVWLGWSEG